MSRYPRTEEGFSHAFRNAVSTAKMHNHKGMRYILYVDKRTPREYAISLSTLVRAEMVQDGTVANYVDAEGNMTKAFPAE